MKQSKVQVVEALIELVNTNSKHSQYQLIHPSLAAHFPEGCYEPAGKNEQQRQAFMDNQLPLEGRSVLDVGANTGFFSFAAVENGARSVVSQEGNHKHAEFISLGAQCLGIQDKLQALPSYFNFLDAPPNMRKFDVTLCLNVLHHVSDDFGNPELSINAAKSEMINSLNRLSSHTEHCWMQMGFNWKGDRNYPLFTNGTKNELIEFIKNGVEGFWDIDCIAIYDPEIQNYVKVSPYNLQRFDVLGEFLNRPLFLLRSL